MSTQISRSVERIFNVPRLRKLLLLLLLYKKEKHKSKIMNFQAGDPVQTFECLFNVKISKVLQDGDTLHIVKFDDKPGEVISSVVGRNDSRH